MMDDHSHDHGSDTHGMDCPMPGCDFTVKVHAHDDDEAALKLMMGVKNHMAETHPDAPAMDQAEVLAMAKNNLRAL